MRLAYVCYWNAFRADGVSAKINAQAAAWRRRGHDATVFCLTPPADGAEQVLAARVFPFAGLTGRVAATRRLQRAVAIERPDVVYLRHDLFLPPPIGVLRSAVSAIEVNTDDRGEMRLRRNRARAYSALTRSAMLRAADGIVCVTHELAASLRRFDAPTAVVANGVDVDVDVDDAVAGPRPPAAMRRAVFLAGNGAPWHGIDKVLALAAAMPDWEFALIGVRPDELPGGAPPNAVAYGPMSRAAYRPLLATSAAGIGTLALHRKRMQEACPLKVREYLAHGLPTIIGYEDTDFIDRDPWYLLRLPNTESNVAGHLDAIRSFLERARGRRVPHEEVAPVISTEVKEDARLAFLAGLVRRRYESATRSA